MQVLSLVVTSSRVLLRWLWKSFRNSFFLQTGLWAYHYQQIVLIDYEFEMSLQTFADVFRCQAIQGFDTVRASENSHWNSLNIFSEGVKISFFKIILAGHFWSLKSLKTFADTPWLHIKHP